MDDDPFHSYSNPHPLKNDILPVIYWYGSGNLFRIMCRVVSALNN